MRTGITKNKVYRNIVNIRRVAGRVILRDSGGWTVDIPAEDFIRAYWEE